MRESKFGPGIGKWAEVNLGKNVDCDWHMDGSLDFYRTTEDIIPKWPSAGNVGRIKNTTRPLSVRYMSTLCFVNITLLVCEI
jgi:hypothetical protein